MSSIQIQFRLNHKSPLYQWVRQMEDSHVNVSEAIRTALECQLAQDINSTYQREYERIRRESSWWRAYKKVIGRNRFQQDWGHIANEMGYNLKPIQNMGHKGHVTEYQETDENLE